MFDFHLESGQKTSSDALIVYVKRWRPSKYEVDSFQEVLVETRSVECLKSKVS